MHHLKRISKIFLDSKYQLKNWKKFYNEFPTFCSNSLISEIFTLGMEFDAIELFTESWFLFYKFLKRRQIPQENVLTPEGIS